MRKNSWNLNKSERMHLKALICFLGLLLLAILLLGKLVLGFLSSEKEPEKEVHIPVVEVLTNVWIMEVDGDGLMIFRDGQKEKYEYGKIIHNIDTTRESAKQNGEQKKRTISGCMRIMQVKRLKYIKRKEALGSRLRILS